MHYTDVVFINGKDYTHYNVDTCMEDHNENEVKLPCIA